jgi:hypothetical protein
LWFFWFHPNTMGRLTHHKKLIDFFLIIFFGNIFMYCTLWGVQLLAINSCILFFNLFFKITWHDAFFSFFKTWTSFKGNKLALKRLFPRNWAIWGAWNFN